MFENCCMTLVNYKLINNFSIWLNIIKIYLWGEICSGYESDVIYFCNMFTLYVLIYSHHHMLWLSNMKVLRYIDPFFNIFLYFGFQFLLTRGEPCFTTYSPAWSNIKKTGVKRECHLSPKTNYWSIPSHFEIWLMILIPNYWES